MKSTREVLGSRLGINQQHFDKEGRKGGPVDGDSSEKMITLSCFVFLFPPWAEREKEEEKGGQRFLPELSLSLGRPNAGLVVDGGNEASCPSNITLFFPPSSLVVVPLWLSPRFVTITVRDVSIHVPPTSSRRHCPRRRVNSWTTFEAHYSLLGFHT